MDIDPGMHSRRLLVVEDEGLIAMHLRRMLIGMGYEVLETVATGEEALEVVSTQMPDLVLMDIKLSGKIDGVQAAGIIGARYRIPVIYLTAHAEDERLSQASLTQPYGYLVKPVQDRELRAAIEMGLYKHQLDQRLRDSEEKYRLLFDRILNGFALFEIVHLEQAPFLEFRFLEVNPAFEALIGIDGAQLVGKGLREVLPEIEAPWIEHSQQAVSESSFQFEVYSKESDRHFEVVVYTPQAGRVAVFLTDVSAHKQAEDLIRRQNETLQIRNDELIQQRQALEEAEAETRLLNQELEKRVEERTAELLHANASLARAARMKDEFLARVSHELRTPLAGILSLSEALQQEVYGSLSGKQHRSLHDIEESGHYLLDLINDILDLSKIEAGKDQLQVSLQHVDDICQSSLRMVRHSVQQKNLKLSFEKDISVNTIYADGRRLKQILVNLLNNAIKFTPEGGSIGLLIEGDQAQEVTRFTVWDTGIGIPLEDMEKLFQPFIQIDNRISHQFTGTGLGLALVSRLAEMHGGSVIVESHSGKGSRFTVCLPWNEKKGPSRVFPSNRISAIRSVSPFQNALVVEDNGATFNQLGRYLEALGIAHNSHPTGGGVLEKVRDLQPDIILLDLILPDRSGWEVFRELKQDPDLSLIPILVVSVIDDRLKALKMGACSCLLKPVGLADLQLALDECANSLTSLDQSQEPAELIQDEVPQTAPLILLAEDNEITRNTLIDYLHTCSFRTVFARDGKEAVEQTRRTKPDLVLMDVQMPNFDGLEAIRYIRSIPEYLDLPIIAITALVMPGDRERCLAAGANEYVNKPVRLADLKEKIEIFLKHPAPGK